MIGKKLTELLNIKYPLIQGGMAGISEARLVSAVSNAGGLGVIGAGLLPPSWLEKQIDETRKLTDKPFGVNLFLQNPKIEELLKVVIKKRVPVVFTGGGNPLPLFPHLQAAEIKIFCVVPSPRLAKKMEDNGADGVVVEGLESGGHIGKNTTFVLIPQTSELIQKVPLVAAGGIYDSKTALAAFLLGADGIQLGTRFLASKECIVSEEYKKRILSATLDDIEVIFNFTGHPLRVLKNEFFQEAKKLEEKNPFPEEVKAEKIAGGLGAGNVEKVPLLAGLSAGGIKEVKSCQEIIEEIFSGLKKELDKFLKEIE